MQVTKGGFMGGLGRGLLGIAVLTASTALLAGSAVQADAVTHRRIPSVVATKAKKPKKAVPACKLLTVAEITQALGTAPTEPPKSDNAAECDYSSPADYNFINLSLSPLATPALWKKSVQGAGAIIPVSGIGDAAFRSANNGTIVVRKGKQTMRIDQYVQGLSETPIENLAKAATARL